MDVKAIDIKSPKLLRVGLVAFFALAFNSACTVESGPLVAPAKESLKFQSHFGISASEQTMQQARYDINEVQVNFRALNGHQNSITGLLAEDFQVSENGIPVHPFSLRSETERINQVADIVFLVDVTGTMSELIESAKLRLRHFIQTSRQQGYHTRMCISTFGNYTVKKCERFFDNNPNDPSTEAQVRELLSELNQLRAFRGAGYDPGWPDLNENPMGALMDAADAPWGESSQRFVILVTDWGFHISPEVDETEVGGEAGEEAEAEDAAEAGDGRVMIDVHYLEGGKGQIPAPRMSEVNQAIEKSQMTVFAVTRMEHTHRGQHMVWDGFNSPLNGQPSIVESSGGEWFDFDLVIRGRVTLDQILQRILDRLNTTYQIRYQVDSIPHLDPTLPVKQRKLDIQVKGHPRASVLIDSVSSTQPQGRPEYKKQWKVGTEDILSDSLQIFVDEKIMTPGEDFKIEGGDVIFAEAPAPGAQLRFVYFYKNPRKNLRETTLNFAGHLNASNTQVVLNGHKVTDISHLIFAHDLEGHTNLSFSEAALSSTSDPYQIWEKQGLSVEVILTQ